MYLKLQENGKRLPTNLEKAHSLHVIDVEKQMQY